MNHDPGMYVGPCIDCTAPVYRRTKSGTPPKRCPTCRRANHARRGNGNGDGPIHQIRILVKKTSPEKQRHIAAAALSEAVGIPLDMARSITDTIDTLLEHGETPNEIRRRLNPNPTGFGKRPAATNHDHDALEEWITPS